MGYITFGKTNATSSFNSGGSGGGGNGIDLDFYKDHGIYMTVMWVGVIQLAIMIIRYFKWWSFSGLLHAMLGTVVLFFTWISAYKTYKKDLLSYNSLLTDDDLIHHSRIAFTISTLTMTQFLLGVFYKYMQVFTTNIKLASFARQMHQILGWTLPIMALVNVRYG